MKLLHVLLALSLVVLLPAGSAVADFAKPSETVTAPHYYSDKAFLVAGGTSGLKSLVTGSAPAVTKNSTTTVSKLRQPVTSQFANRTDPLTVRIGTGTTGQSGVKLFSKSFSYKGLP